MKSLICFKPFGGAGWTRSLVRLLDLVMCLGKLLSAPRVLTVVFFSPLFRMRRIRDARHGRGMRITIGVSPKSLLGFGVPHYRRKLIFFFLKSRAIAALAPIVLRTAHWAVLSRCATAKSKITCRRVRSFLAGDSIPLPRQVLRVSRSTRQRLNAHSPIVAHFRRLRFNSMAHLIFARTFKVWLHSRAI